MSSLRPPAREPRAEDDVGDAVSDGLDEGGHFRRVVFEIGVLDHGDLAVDVGYGRPDRRALPAVRLTQEEPAVPAVLPLVEDRRRPVARPVVDDDHLFVQLERVDTTEHFRDRRGLVVDGNEKGDPVHGRSLRTYSHSSRPPLGFHGSRKTSHRRTSSGLAAA